MQASAEVRGDDHLVLEQVGAVQQVIEMSVAKLVNQGRALVGGDEGQLHDQDLGPVGFGKGVEARRGCVTQVGDLGQTDLGRDFDSREPQVADLVVRKGSDTRA